MRGHRKLRHALALLACSGAAVAGSLAGSEPALASGSLTCSNTWNSGASVQGLAQKEVWFKGYPSFSACSALPALHYDKTSSGNGLAEFGNITHVLEPANDNSPVEGAGAPVGVLNGFTGTEDAPSGGELGNAEHAAFEATLVELTIPVTQSSVAVLLSLPAKCKITASPGRVSIQNQNLDKLWLQTVPAGGSDSQNGGGAYPANTWGAFFALIGLSAFENQAAGNAGCEDPITLQVRSNDAGTSYTFKGYLGQLDNVSWHGYETDAPVWPVNVSESFNGHNNASNGNLATHVAEDPGAIGYANVADAANIFSCITACEAGKVPFSAETKETTEGPSAEEHQILWARVQNNGTSLTSPGYTGPATGSGATATANCATEKITPSEQGAPYSVTDSWSGVLASDPNATGDLSGNFYPICELTYDLAWKHYAAPNLAAYYNDSTAGQESTDEGVEETTKDYLTYVTSSVGGEGQAAIQSWYYQKLPTAILTKAQDAVAYIGL
jgi:ABC-type phosphate transport system substrate-binding protein